MCFFLFEKTIGLQKKNVIWNTAFVVPPGQAAPELGQWQSVESDDVGAQTTDDFVDDGARSKSKHNSGQASLLGAADDDDDDDDDDGDVNSNKLSSAADEDGNLDPLLAAEGTKEMSLAMQESLAAASNTGNTGFKKRKRKAGGARRKKLTVE